jgi:hypothetical protein
MTAKWVWLACMAAVLLLAPLAVADQGNDTGGSGFERPDDAAWVEDCPPDMMCAFGGADGDNAWVEDCPPDMMCALDDDNVTRGPEDCAFCRDHQDADCLECLGSGAPGDDTTWGTDCRSPASSR